MKTLQVVFTEAEFRKLKKAKQESGYTCWHGWIISKCTKGVSEKRNGNRS